MLGSLILYLKGHEDNDVPTFWLLLYSFANLRGWGVSGNQMTRLRDAVLALAHPSDLTAEAIYGV